MLSVYVCTCEFVSLCVCESFMQHFVYGVHLSAYQNSITYSTHIHTRAHMTWHDWQHQKRIHYNFNRKIFKFCVVHSHFGRSLFIEKYIYWTLDSHLFVYLFIFISVFNVNLRAQNEKRQKWNEKKWIGSLFYARIFSKLMGQKEMGKIDGTLYL